MSYQNKSGSPKTIRFYYMKDTILNRLQLETATRAKQIKDDKGEAQFDDFTLTQDERSLFNIHLANAVADVLKVFLKWTKDIPAGDVIDTEGMESTTSDVTSDDFVEFEILDNEGYKAATIVWIDRKVKEMLILYVKAGWYGSVGLDDYEAKFTAQYNDAKRDLVNKGIHDLLKVDLS